MKLYHDPHHGSRDLRPWCTPVRRKLPWDLVFQLAVAAGLILGLAWSMYYISYHAALDAFEEGLRIGHLRGRWDERREQEDRRREEMYQRP